MTEQVQTHLVQIHASNRILTGWGIEWLEYVNNVLAEKLPSRAIINRVPVNTHRHHIIPRLISQDVCRRNRASCDYAQPRLLTNQRSDKSNLRRFSFFSYQQINNWRRRFPPFLIVHGSPSGMLLSVETQLREMTKALIGIMCATLMRGLICPHKIEAEMTTKATTFASRLDGVRLLRVNRLLCQMNLNLASMRG